VQISIPNILTICRILLTPLFVILVQRNLFGHALLIFTLAGVSDALDGLIARIFNQRTQLGAFLDPIADKLLLVSAFVSLSIPGILPGWLAVIVISRDVMILMGIAVLTITGVGFQIQPSWISKCTTFAQIAAIFLTLLQIQMQASQLAVILGSLHWLTAAVTILSGLHYIYLGMGILQAGTDQGAGRERDPDRRP
jgi:cardiolipin synthase